MYYVISIKKSKSKPQDPPHKRENIGVVAVNEPHPI